MEQKISEKQKNAKQMNSSSPDVVVERTINAPVDRVWEAWANPELVKQWWGPETYSCPDAKSDFREGGKYLYAMKSPKGEVSWGGGTFEEIIPNQRLVYTDQFTDENGNPVSAKVYGLSEEFPETTVTVTFEPKGQDRTMMKLVHEGIPQAEHDNCVEGWTSTVDKLQRLVERM